MGLVPVRSTSTLDPILESAALQKYTEAININALFGATTYSSLGTPYWTIGIHNTIFNSLFGRK